MVNAKGIEKSFLLSADSWDDAGADYGDIMFYNQGSKPLELTEYARAILEPHQIKQKPFTVMILYHSTGTVEFMREDQTSVTFKVALTVVEE